MSSPDEGHNGSHDRVLRDVWLSVDLQNGSGFPGDNVNCARFSLAAGIRMGDGRGVGAKVLPGRWLAALYRDAMAADA